MVVNRKVNIPELNIYDWIIIKFHYNLHINHLLHLGPTLYDWRRRTGVDLQTCNVSRNNF